MGSSMLVWLVGRAGRVLVSSPCKYNYLGSQFGGIVSRGSGVLKAYSSVAAAGGSSRALLMLPSSFDTPSVIKAYSVAEEKVIRINKETGPEGLCMEEWTVVGSSQGWVALYNWKSYEGEMHLWHPLLGRGVKLPLLSSLPDVMPEIDHRGNGMRVAKVIISCSPDDEEEEECRAMMIYGDVGMAYWRHTDDKWTHPTGGEIVKLYSDIVYSRFHKLFFCITNKNELEAWDLLSNSNFSASPFSTSHAPVSVDRLKYEDEDENEEQDQDEEDCDTNEIKHMGKYLVFEDEDEDEDEDENEEQDQDEDCDTNEVKHMAKYLVFEDEEEDSLLLVTRHMVSSLSWEYPPWHQRTTGFDVHRVDRDNGKLHYLNKSLGGLSIFLGNNHSVALKSPKLKPNSIYFTDANASVYSPKYKNVFCGQDIGVFDYQNTTLSPCYYNPPVTHISNTIPPPFWYFT